MTAALTRGAYGALTKWMCPAELVDAIVRVAEGEVVVADDAVNDTATDPWECPPSELSEREADVVALICQGLSNEQVGAELFLSIDTVTSYIRTAYRKMGVGSRSQAVLWGPERGYGRAGRDDTTTESDVPPDRADA